MQIHASILKVRNILLNVIIYVKQIIIVILAAMTNRRQTTVKNLIRRQDIIIIITEVFDFLIISLGVIVSFYSLV